MVEQGWRVLIVSAGLTSSRCASSCAPTWRASFPGTHEALVSLILAAAQGADLTSREVAGIIASDDDPLRPALSDQELRALQLYASGMKMTSVARQMNVSVHTAKEHRPGPVSTPPPVGR